MARLSLETVAAPLAAALAALVAAPADGAAVLAAGAERGILRAASLRVCENSGCHVGVDGLGSASRLIACELGEDTVGADGPGNARICT